MVDKFELTANSTNADGEEPTIESLICGIREKSPEYDLDDSSEQVVRSLLEERLEQAEQERQQAAECRQRLAERLGNSTGESGSRASEDLSDAEQARARISSQIGD